MELDTTPTRNTLPFRAADFSNLAEALDYAAQGVTGCNFYTGRGEVYAVVSYARVREEALALARRFKSLELERGARVALVAETHPDFLRFFFACQYAGLVPVPLPIPISFGGHRAYVEQLRGMLVSCGAAVGVASAGFLNFLKEAAAGLEIFVGTPADFEALPAADGPLHPLQSSELAYIQYTSGSTRFPRGVMITQETVMSNLAGIIKHGVQIGPEDRCVSWLPFYHDMGFVGLVLVPVTAQLSVDYLGTRDFAMRPRQWLSLLSRTRATISFGPPFGYELVERCLRPEEAHKYDLSAWRVAGVGAEMIRPEPLRRFAELLAPSGFDARAFLACYGMAECSLAISFASLNQGLQVDSIDADHLAKYEEARPVPDGGRGQDLSPRVRDFVICGKPLPDFEVEIRDEQGRPLGERRSGVIYLRGPSVMSGYFGEPEITRQTLSEDGWLNTGDVGYRLGDSLVITGRKKDLIIINGRNIWPQDLEYLAEQQPEVRTGDALAFSAPGPNGEETTVMVVQCREKDPARQASLVSRLKQRVRSELGIDCYVELVPLHTLPRTSSGKLSRSKARQNFIETHDWDAPSVVAGDS